MKKHILPLLCALLLALALGLLTLWRNKLGKWRVPFTAYSVVLCLIRKQSLCWQDVLFGVLLSVPNYLSTRFLLLSLNHLPAVVVFPSFSAGTIVLATLAGILLFKEKLTLRKGLALLVILAALVLLNL